MKLFRANELQNIPKLQHLKWFRIYIYSTNTLSVAFCVCLHETKQFDTSLQYVFSLQIIFLALCGISVVATPFIYVLHYLGLSWSKSRNNRLIHKPQLPLVFSVLGESRYFNILSNFCEKMSSYSLSFRLVLPLFPILIVNDLY